MSSPSSPPGLTQEQKDHFLAHGWIKIPQAFTPAQAESLTSTVFTRLGFSPTDKSTWTRHRTNMPGHRLFPASEFAPAAWSAICELLGSSPPSSSGSGDSDDLITPDSAFWKDSLIVNLGTACHENRPVPPRDLDGWHVDGDFFVHYLDSPEQGLLVIPLFSHVPPDGGGTVICPAAIPVVARHLYEHPEGVSPRMTPRGQEGFCEEKDLGWFNAVARRCADEGGDDSVFVEATGDVGDVYLLHPLMLHSASSNPKRNVRIITNPRVSLRDPFRFDRRRSGEGEERGAYSLVEEVTLRALGKGSGVGLEGWRITREREAVVPERVRIQERMRLEELARLEAQEKMRNKNEENVGLGEAAVSATA